MKLWNIPSVEEVKISDTSSPKNSSCPGVNENGTCTYWCNGDNGKRPECKHYSGYCKLSNGCDYKS